MVLAFRTLAVRLVGAAAGWNVAGTTGVVTVLAALAADDLIHRIGSTKHNLRQRPNLG